ncbi:deferrochelatase/peroxidase EfeB [Enhydrobacter aerosaccus]|uniref:Deferrochelatase/peroxidase EfeB n=1 Tax=Enhydrobacter aerosaccus TaxID=225324 RepID=A0A1T4TKB0_9HYPH|nr:Dyp-type peroxidase [Enhydrobacter aerosaccus]SKA40847.1 deferrochelatase/peroxidase EfeB [Enhydrobacter aerosaccus]
MSDDRDPGTRRRGFLTGVAGVVGALGAASAASAKENISPVAVATAGKDILPFHGLHQNGIATPMQGHAYFATFDLVTEKRADIVSLMKVWTTAAARLTTGETAQPLDAGLKPAVAPPAGGRYDASYLTPAAGKAGGEGGETLGQPPTGLGDTQGPNAVAADSGESLGQSPAKLTITFGFGAGLFVKDGKDRYGLAARRPAALVDLPKFVGDQLVEGSTGGDLLVQACADDPQVVFHAVRQLARLAEGVAQIRWAQTGFVPGFGNGETPRNLMGFKDGTNNPAITDPKAMDEFVWVGTEGPDWMRGGTYAVTRRIRIALERWDQMKVAFQEETVGRHKYSGAPIGKDKEFDAFDFDAKDKDGNPLTAENSHVRLAAPATNDGAQILRRGYSYNDGVNLTAERWPPWRQGLEYDAGLFFVCYQRDPRTGFIKVFERMAKFDMMNQFVTHVGSGLFACPPGAAADRYIGQALFETA